MTLEEYEVFIIFSQRPFLGQFASCFPRGGNDRRTLRVSA